MVYVSAVHWNHSTAGHWILRKQLCNMRNAVFAKPITAVVAIQLAIGNDLAPLRSVISNAKIIRVSFDVPSHLALKVLHIEVTTFEGVEPYKGIDRVSKVLNLKAPFTAWTCPSAMLLQHVVKIDELRLIANQHFHNQLP